jgi:hypothetical protein
MCRETESRRMPRQELTGNVQRITSWRPRRAALKSSCESYHTTLGGPSTSLGAVPSNVEGRLAAGGSAGWRLGGLAVRGWRLGGLAVRGWRLGVRGWRGWRLDGWWLAVRGSAQWL